MNRMSQLLSSALHVSRHWAAAVKRSEWQQKWAACPARVTSQRCDPLRSFTVLEDRSLWALQALALQDELTQADCTAGVKAWQPSKTVAQLQSPGQFLAFPSMFAFISADALKLKTLNGCMLRLRISSMTCSSFRCIVLLLVVVLVVVVVGCCD